METHITNLVNEKVSKIKEKIAGIAKFFQRV